MENETSRSLNILYIEDDVTMQSLMGFYLKNLPHQIDYANEGNAAISLLKEQEFDLIIMDWSLPTAPIGQNLVNSIRQIQGYEATPIIVVTGFDNPEDLEGLQRNTIQGFLAKPINRVKLKNLITQYS